MALFGLGPALASPATDLFREAGFYLEFYYNGYSTVNPADLVDKYQFQLEDACQPQGEACGFEVARGFIQRMISELQDGHTYYLSNRVYTSALAEYAGINPDMRPVFGFSLVRAVERGEVLIGEVRAGGAASSAGLQPWDRVLGVNGETNPSNSTALEFVRSKINTDAPVTLKIARGFAPNVRVFDVRLTRRYLKNANLPYLYVPSGVPDGVFVLRIPSFVGYNDIGPKVHELVRLAKAKKAKAIILDVRGNGGGEETECTAAAAPFTNGSVEFIMQGRLQTFQLGFKNGAVLGNDPRDQRTYKIANPALWTGPTAVLVDRSTGSCAELLAYWVQRAKRGPVVGTRTYGVLNTATDFFQLIDQSAMAITYVRSLNPDGTPFPEFITPDVEFQPEERARDTQLDRALEVLGVR